MVCAPVKSVVSTFIVLLLENLAGFKMNYNVNCTNMISIASTFYACICRPVHAKSNSCWKLWLINMHCHVITAPMANKTMSHRNIRKLLNTCQRNLTSSVVSTELTEHYPRQLVGTSQMHHLNILMDLCSIRTNLKSEVDFLCR